MPSRTEFQALADLRVAEAGALLAAQQWSGAYYLAGYAAEFGLKACIAKLIRAEEFPDKTFANDCFTHDLGKLLALAGLGTEWKRDATPGSRLAQFWQTAKDWNEKSRYAQKPESDARELYEAITDQTDGVLTWIRQRW